MSPEAAVVLALIGVALGFEMPVPRFSGRIVGGEPTTIEQYPYQLSLRSNHYHICGASIIAPKFALTAAHCVNSASVYRLSLHSGTSYQSTSGTRHQAITITVHSEYRGNDYDFALIEVAEPFEIGTAGVDAIPLATIEPSYDQPAVITGWGALSAGGSSPNQLQAVRVPIITRQTCQSKYPMYTISKRMICAASQTGGKDACQGDSGGPLVVNGKLSGVVSWGIGCADAKYPGVYANVADQNRWIRTNAGL